jgi:hypothetical protein
MISGTKSVIPDQKRFGNDIFGAQRKISANQEAK